MTITKCDRCGEEIISFPWQNMVLPSYQITACYDSCNMTKIDLCHECEKEFTEWLHNKDTKFEAGKD